jgi:hypothetical protein
MVNDRAGADVRMHAPVIYQEVAGVFRLCCSYSIEANDGVTS